MTDYNVDRQDLEFVLNEQFSLEAMCDYPLYSEFSRDMFDMMLAEGIKFAKNELFPINQQTDQDGVKLVDGQVKVSEVFQKVYPRYIEAGFFSMAMNQEFGGLGLPFPLCVALMEILIGACSSFMFFPGLTVAAGHLVEVFGTTELKSLCVPKMYAGEWAGTMCLTEPQAGTAVGDLSTTATKIEGSNEYAIKGQKIFISAGDHDLVDNILHLVLARVPGDPQGTKGISLFLVPKRRFDATGKLGATNDVAVTGIEHKMGIHGSPTCSLSFGDNGDCRGYLIGEQTKGIVYMFQMMNEARIVCGIQGSGAANASYQMALAYAKERVQGAKVTDRSKGAKSVAIVEHPDVRRNLMMCKAISEGIRALLVSTAFYADHAKNAPDKATRDKYDNLLEILTPVCKAYATDEAFEVTELAIQLHGGYGYIKEYGVEQQMRDLKIASLYEGTNGVQALDLLGRKMRIKNGGLFLTWLQETNAFVQEHAEHDSLADLVKAIDDAKNALAMTAFGFGEQGKKNQELALLGATPFLEMFGHVEVGRLLVHQAIIARGSLDAIVKDAGANSPEGLRKLIKDNSKARFYDGKIKTARFFVNNKVVLVKALAKSISSDDTSALDIVF